MGSYLPTRQLSHRDRPKSPNYHPASSPAVSPNRFCPPSTLVNLPLQLSSALYKSPLFMQNKPNLQNPKTSAISYAAGIYANIPLRAARKNKPNQTQFPALCCAGKESTISERSAYPYLSGKHQRSSIQYRDSTILSILPGNHESIAQNKPNPQNHKTNATSYATKIYTDIPLRYAQKNKPNQTRRRARGGPI